MPNPLQPTGTDNISADAPTTRSATASSGAGHAPVSKSDVIRVVLVQLTTAALFGYVIGFVGVYNTLNGINLDCKQYTTEAACNSPRFTVCAWQGPSKADNTTTGSCYFSDVNCYALDEDSCRSRDDLCKYNYDDGECEHRVGFDSFFSGIFSGSMTVGAFAGSVIGGLVVGRIGRKGTLLSAALLNVVASVLVHVSRGIDQYWLLIAARVMLGLGCGAGCVAAPMYTEEMCPEPYRTTIGATFQVFCTLGIAMAAAMGLIVEPHDFAAEQNNEVRIQMVIMVQTLMCLMSAAVCVLIPESNTYLHMKAVAGGNKKLEAGSPQPGATGANVNSDGCGATVDAAAIQLFPAGNDKPPIRVYPFSQMIVPLLTAFILCVGQQLTGINAIMNYAPSITTAMGLTALLGNFIIMVWNFVSSIFSIPASKYFSLRQMFIAGVLITTCAMLIAGIPTYPGVLEDETARHALAGLGIFLFILAFEVGVGPAFYVLSQALFPTSFRPVGSSFTLSVQYLFNLVINVFFPIATEKFSGGPSGNQDKGLAIVFFFFAGCGALSFILLLKFLYPFDESKVEPDMPKRESAKPVPATEIP